MILSAPAPILGLISAFRTLVAELWPLGPTKIRSKTQRKAGHVTLLGAGPGAADLITVRGLATLQMADIIDYDRLVDPALLAHAKPGARCVSVGKAPGRHSVPQDQINARLVQSAQHGHTLVRLKCGDPGIFGRGAEEAQTLTQAGIPWTVLPGITAACAAPGTTLACYMGVSITADLQQGLLAAGWPETCPIEVIFKAQTPEQRVLRGCLRNLGLLCRSEQNLNPAVLLIRWPDKQPAERFVVSAFNAHGTV